MFRDEIIPSQTSARNFCSAIFITNLLWRWSRESPKTLHCSYENFNRGVPIIIVDDILCETIKHVKKEHIGTFYRDAYRKFVTVLKEVELKDLYSHEINFKAKFCDIDHIYRILPLPPRRGNERQRKNLPNAVFVKMFFPTTVSDTAIKKSFLEFGESHDLFDGEFKKPYNNISKGQRHTRTTPYNYSLELLPSMTFSMKYSLMSLTFFRSCGLRGKYNAKIACTHMLWYLPPSSR